MIIIPMLMSAFVGADVATDGQVSRDISESINSIELNIFKDNDKCINRSRITDSTGRTFRLCELEDGSYKMIQIEDL